MLVVWCTVRSSCVYMRARFLMQLALLVIRGVFRLPPQPNLVRYGVSLIPSIQTYLYPRGTQYPQRGMQGVQNNFLGV